MVLISLYVDDKRALPEDERLVITLAYTANCSHRQIAAFLNIAPAQVNNRLRRARSRLAARLRQGATLRAWEADFDPLPSLVLQEAEARGTPEGFRLEALIRNLSADTVGGARLHFEVEGGDEPWIYSLLAPLATPEGYGLDWPESVPEPMQALIGRFENAVEWTQMIYTRHR